MGKRIPASGKKPTAKTPPPRDAVIGDNSQTHGEEAERVQLISFVSRINSANEAVEAAKAPFDAAKKNRNQLFALAKAAGFTRKEIEQRMEEMNTPSREFAERAAREHKHRRWLGIMDDDQQQLILGDKAPQEAKDEAHWRAEGYKAGLRQMEAKPPKECAERFVQPWLEEHARGLKTVLEANAPKPMPGTAAAVAAQAAKDFAEDNPGTIADERLTETRQVNKAKEALAAMGTDAPTTDPEAPFEATEEELAAQSTRQAVIGAREADDHPEDDPNNQPCPHCGADAGVPCDPECPGDAEPEAVV